MKMEKTNSIFSKKFSRNIAIYSHIKIERLSNFNINYLSLLTSYVFSIHKNKQTNCGF